MHEKAFSEIKKIPAAKFNAATKISVKISCIEISGDGISSGEIRRGKNMCQNLTRWKFIGQNFRRRKCHAVKLSAAKISVGKFSFAEIFSGEISRGEITCSEISRDEIYRGKNVIRRNLWWWNLPRQTYHCENILISTTPNTKMHYFKYLKSRRKFNNFCRKLAITPFFAGFH